MKEMPTAKLFAALFISCAVVLSRSRRVVAGFDRRPFLRSASRARAIACQHFFKPEAVFFDALVYSRWSASRFPNARSD
jgi:hypothetical protein